MDAPRPFIFPAKYIGNHDGDTVNVDIDLGFSTWRLKEPIRILGIDTPEITPKPLDAEGKRRKADSMAREHNRAIAARDFLAGQLGAAHAVFLESHSLDKYGRSLGDILYQSDDGWHSVRDEMLKAGHAVAYGPEAQDGLTKTHDWGAP